MTLLETAPHERLGRLSHTQRQIWTGQQLHPNLPLYNMAMRFDIAAALNHAVFNDAFQQEPPSDS